MADSPITTEELHTKLGELIADTAAKAIRSGNGFEWEDVQAVIDLVFRTTKVRSYPAGTRDEPREYAIHAAFGACDEDEFLTDIEVTTALSRVVLDGAAYIGEGAAYVREYRDYIAASVAKLDEWLDAHPD